MNHIKQNTVGIDTPIQRLQKTLYEKLAYSNFEGYGRAYVIEKTGGENTRTIPTHFEPPKEYREILMNDQTHGNFFFVENNTEYVNHNQETEIDIIFQLNLEKLEPNIAERADEEVRVKILNILHPCKYFSLSQTVRGLDALEGFDTNLKDMQPFHYLKISGTLRYKINC